MTCCKNETWRQTTVDQDYEVSSCGRVRSWRKKGRYGGRLEKPHLLKLRLDADGRTRAAINGRDHFHHHLVLEAFVGARPENMEACHGDGDSTNNHLWNLRWDTHLANEADKAVHGTRVYGEKHKLSKLTSTQIEEIRSALQQGKRQKTLANRYGVSRSLISMIGTGRIWTQTSTEGCVDYAGRNARKLTRALVNQIKQELGLGFRQNDIAAKFGVAQCTVSNIATGKRWAS